MEQQFTKEEIESLCTRAVSAEITQDAPIPFVTFTLPQGSKAIVPKELIRFYDLLDTLPSQSL
jgi:hypothetical protein